MKLSKVFSRGLVMDNPVFIQALGMCPILAVTNTAFNSFGMGMATTSVLLGSNIVVSLLRKFIPAKIRIPCFIVVIATFVTMVGMIMEAFFPALDQALGIFIPLIVVNCLILGRAESFASKNNTIGSITDALGMGLGFTGALVLLGIVREVIGFGTIFDIQLFGDSFEPMGLMTMAPGAFMALGILMAVFNRIVYTRLK
ncbi:electron transport complex subunit RsxE [Tindallia californiensis]|uniref:Ion-translocating oxidoreductase complex subunit E n=1 Tax=Tindallia californiensis TaxID=159292 RepID=A0A1H3NB21_9FIRM|nr:electron transport complex subunit E [Tindallia californiensis]SDY86131.1 electron transport complex protein RnfE [Tindallia californiensis]